MSLRKNLFIVLMFLGIASANAQSTSETAPLVLRADPAVFSPDGDGFQDQTFFLPVLNRSLETIRWRLDIAGAKGRVARLNGPGIPALVPWSGKGKKGEVLPDGVYTAKFNLWAQGSRLSAVRDIRLDTMAPHVSLVAPRAILKLQGGGATSFVLTPAVADVSPIDHWQFQVLDNTGRTVYLAWSSGTVTSLEWDGRDKVSGVLAPRGVYRCAFQAWDVAGNGSEPAFADVTIDVTPRELLSSALERIRYHKIDRNILVPLSAERLFKRGTARPELSDAGQVLLREAAILVQAYPQAAIELDGYADDRDHSSLYAWTVYSHLVKRENVSGSRITVRGRGRTPLPSRRLMKPPAVRNGVEIILRDVAE